MSTITTTPVYDAFWRFAAERQSVMYRRIQGFPHPWTIDPIIGEYKFTNPYRAADRVSQYLIRDVMHLGGQAAYSDPNMQDLFTPDEVFFRTIIFKMFNRIDTWQWLNVDVVGPTITSYDLYIGHCNHVLKRLVDNGVPVYTSAYMTPSPPQSMGGKQKYEAHLDILQQMLAESVPDRIQQCASMAGAYAILRTYPMIGDFLAYQFRHRFGLLRRFPFLRDGLHRARTRCQGRHTQVLLRFGGSVGAQHHPHDGADARGGV